MNLKRIKISLFLNDMILYLANYRKSMLKLTLTRKVFSEVEGYKINIHKSVAFVYTNNSQLEDIIIEMLSFTIATKKIIYLKKEPNKKCGKKKLM